jgi:hypothetical protein
VSPDRDGVIPPDLGVGNQIVARRDRLSDERGRGCRAPSPTPRWRRWWCARWRRFCTPDELPGAVS